MTPENFEKQIASYYSSMEYKVTMTPKSSDYGVDIIADKYTEKFAIQVKLYDVRISNYKDIMYLYAGSKYYDCNKSVFITNGTISKDDKKVAQKLNVEIFENWDKGTIPNNPANIQNVQAVKSTLKGSGEKEFGDVWTAYIIPLINKSVSTITGKSNKITAVNYSYLERESSNGNTSKIDYSIFEQCYYHLLEKGKLTRDEINHLYTKRASAVIFAVLAHIPFFSVKVKPKATLIYKIAN